MALSLWASLLGVQLDFYYSLISNNYCWPDAFRQIFELQKFCITLSAISETKMCSGLGYKQSSKNSFRLTPWRFFLYESMLSCINSFGKLLSLKLLIFTEFVKKLYVTAVVFHTMNNNSISILAIRKINFRGIF